MCAAASVRGEKYQEARDKVWAVRKTSRATFQASLQCQ